MLKDYLFEDDNNGYFLVEEENYTEALRTVHQNFGVTYTMENISFIRELDVEEGERLGYDTY